MGEVYIGEEGRRIDTGRCGMFCAYVLFVELEKVTKYDRPV
jgi:hypothetical protein